MVLMVSLRILLSASDLASFGESGAESGDD